MENVTLDRAAEIVKALTPEEQSQLRAMIDSWQTEAPAEATPEQQRRGWRSACWPTGCWNPWR